MEYMAYPRAAALAEVVWSAHSMRDYDSFMQRLTDHLLRLEALQVNYRPPGDDEIGLWANIKQMLLDAVAGTYFWYSDRRFMDQQLFSHVDIRIQALLPVNT